MRNFSEKSYLYYSIGTNINKVEICHVLYKQSCTANKRFRKVWTIYIKNFDQKINFYVSDETETRYPFYRFFSTFWYIFGGHYTHVIYSWAQITGYVNSSVS